MDSDEVTSEAVLRERIAHVEERITHVATRLDDKIECVDQRYHDHIAQLELRLQQRFEAQEHAVAALFNGQKEAVAAALLCADRAVSKAEIASEKRFEAVNEFRRTLSDQAVTFVTRQESDIKYIASDARLRELTGAMEKLRDVDNLSRGKSLALSNAATMGLASLAIVITVVVAIYQHGLPGSPSISSAPQIYLTPEQQAKPPPPRSP